jgi:Family of unknown function (DUF6526)
MPEPQNFQNHTRYHTPFHFVFAPLALINLMWSIYNLYRSPGAGELQGIVIALAILMAGFLARTSALKAQDRVIRLEENLRYQKILSPELAKKAEALTPGQLVALRFASDAELAGLVQQTLDGKFEKGKDIKQAIKNWRGDDLRV